MESRKLFQDVLFELFKDNKYCDRLMYQFMRAFDMFSKNVSGFNRMSTKTQYFICETAYRISMASSSSVTRRVSIFRNKNEYSDNEKEYSLEYGYADPCRIEINTEDIQVFNHDFKRANQRT